MGFLERSSKEYHPAIDLMVWKSVGIEERTLVFPKEKLPQRQQESVLLK